MLSHLNNRHLKSQRTIFYGVSISILLRNGYVLETLFCSLVVNYSKQACFNYIL